MSDMLTEREQIQRKRIYNEVLKWRIRTKPICDYCGIEFDQVIKCDKCGKSSCEKCGIFVVPTILCPKDSQLNNDGQYECGLTKEEHSYLNSVICQKCQ